MKKITAYLRLVQIRRKRRLFFFWRLVFYSNSLVVRGDNGVYYGYLSSLVLLFNLLKMYYIFHVAYFWRIFYLYCNRRFRNCIIGLIDWSFRYRGGGSWGIMKIRWQELRVRVVWLRFVRLLVERLGNWGDIYVKLVLRGYKNILGLILRWLIYYYYKCWKSSIRFIIITALLQLPYGFRRGKKYPSRKKRIYRR